MEKPDPYGEWVLFGTGQEAGERPRQVDDQNVNSRAPPPICYGNLYAAYLGCRVAFVRSIGRWSLTALVVNSIIGSNIFGLPSELNRLLGRASPIAMLVAVLGGIVFSLCLRLSGSLWWGIGFHFTWDWAQSFFYGTRDSGSLVRGHLFGSHPIGDVRMSGGSVGPEGSVFVLPVLCIALVVVSVTLRRHTLSDSPKLTTPMR